MDTFIYTNLLAIYNTFSLNTVNGIVVFMNLSNSTVLDMVEKGWMSCFGYVSSSML